MGELKMRFMTRHKSLAITFLFCACTQLVYSWTRNCDEWFEENENPDYINKRFERLRSTKSNCARRCRDAKVCKSEPALVDLDESCILIESHSTIFGIDQECRNYGRKRKRDLTPKNLNLRNRRYLTTTDRITSVETTTGAVQTFN